MEDESKEGKQYSANARHLLTSLLRCVCSLTRRLPENTRTAQSPCLDPLATVPQPIMSYDLLMVSHLRTEGFWSSYADNAAFVPEARAKH